MAARRLPHAVGRLDQQQIAGGMAERVIDHLELVKVETVKREKPVASLETPETMLELLLEHGPVGKSGERVVECELRDAFLAFGNLAHHRVEASGEARKLVLAANPDLHVLACGEPSGGIVEPCEGLGDPLCGAPRGKSDN